MILRYFLLQAQSVGLTRKISIRHTDMICEIFWLPLPTFRVLVEALTPQERRSGTCWTLPDICPGSPAYSQRESSTKLTVDVKQKKFEKFFQLLIATVNVSEHLTLRLTSLFEFLSLELAWIGALLLSFHGALAGEA